MAKKRKISAHQRKFGKAGRAAMVICHRETNSLSAFGTCMKREMAARLGKKRKSKSATTRTSGRKCKGIYQTGSKRGRLKPGYKYPGGGRCPRKVA